jgi:hypothetical protein
MYNVLGVADIYWGLVINKEKGPKLWNTYKTPLTIDIDGITTATDRANLYITDSPLSDIYYDNFRN